MIAVNTDEFLELRDLLLDPFMCGSEIFIDIGMVPDGGVGGRESSELDEDIAPFEPMFASLNLVGFLKFFSLLVIRRLVKCFCA